MSTLEEQDREEDKLDRIESFLWRAERDRLLFSDVLELLELRELLELLLDIKLPLGVVEEERDVDVLRLFSHLLTNIYLFSEI
eukprot:TRINITY_DN3849_c0_g1_i1.p1 TRINITY_DN3849_c0_g1~~TRINITY_DN3849_c0_g1_i1.p1  ORF type:complete len:83 (-),score=9.29 TRINITY_DN3849_c0_g1_i1:753-1001(-)